MLNELATNFFESSYKILSIQLVPCWCEWYTRTMHIFHLIKITKRHFEKDYLQNIIKSSCPSSVWMLFQPIKIAKRHFSKKKTSNFIWNFMFSIFPTKVYLWKLKVISFSPLFSSNLFKELELGKGNDEFIKNFNWGKKQSNFYNLYDDDLPWKIKIFIFHKLEILLIIGKGNDLSWKKFYLEKFLVISKLQNVFI